MLTTLQKITSPTLSGPSLSAFKEAVIESIDIQNSLVLLGVQMQILSFTIIGSSGTKLLRRRVTIVRPLAGGKELQSMPVMYSFSVVWQFIVPLRTSSSAAMARFYFSTSTEAFITLSQLLLNATNSGVLTGFLSYLDPVTYRNVSVSHLFSTSSPSTAPTYSPTELSAASFFVSLNHLLSANILIASLCAGLLYVALSISMCYCITYRRNTRKIRENKQYVQDKVSALQAVADSLAAQKSALPSHERFIRNRNQVSPLSDLEFATGIIPSSPGNSEKKNRRQKTVAPDDLHALCAQVSALHVKNNALRAQLTLPARRLNNKIDSYIAAAASATQSPTEGDIIFGAKEMKRLKTYFYLLEREQTRLLAMKRTAASKRPAGDDRTPTSRSLYSVVPETTSSNLI